MGHYIKENSIYICTQHKIIANGKQFRQKCLDKLKIENCNNSKLKYKLQSSVVQRVKFLCISMVPKKYYPQKSEYIYKIYFSKLTWHRSTCYVVSSVGVVNRTKNWMKSKRYNIFYCTMNWFRCRNIIRPFAINWIALKLNHSND